ncbi:MAG: hypothetical protein IT319_05505 [Anaerolineae bacterium]|nr:hypothetical protein [Anaerolineae bacterium]
MTAFCSLYLPDAAEIARPIRAALAALGYEFFDPFGLIPGKAYPQAVRLFVAPARGGWTRVLGAPDPALLPSLSQTAPCLLVELDGANARIEAYAGGAPASPEAAFAAYLRSPDCLDKEPVATATRPALGGVALDALPDDVRALAKTVDLKQAESMFARLSGSLAAKTGGDSGDLLRQPEWDSAGGRTIRALLTCLSIPGWQTPDFVTLRDAYALHKRRQRSPNATLYPGDAEALAAVPDALAYTPIYAGKAK